MSSWYNFYVQVDVFFIYVMSEYDFYTKMLDRLFIE